MDVPGIPAASQSDPKNQRPDKSKGKGAWDCFVLEFGLNLFKAGRDLGPARKLTKRTLLMRSTATRGGLGFDLLKRLVPP